VRVTALPTGYPNDESLVSMPTRSPTTISAIAATMATTDPR
jgi:hypothetical protein